MLSFSLDLIMILCFLAGTALIITEAFIPGFGITGTSGIILEIIAVVCCFKAHGIVAALLALLAVLIVIGLAVFFSYRSALNGRLSRSPLVLKSTESAVPDKAAEEDSLVGREAVTVTALRPAGFIEAGGRRVSARSTGDFVAKGVPVVITGAEGGQYVIRPKGNAP